MNSIPPTNLLALCAVLAALPAPLAFAEEHDSAYYKKKAKEAEAKEKKEEHKEHMTATEVAVAGALVGAFASAHSGHPYPSPPPPPRIVYFTDSRGAVPVYLTPLGNGGYTGPRGEFYDHLPGGNELARVYGRFDPPPPQSWDRSNAGPDYNQPPPPPPPAALKVRVEQGQVRLLRDGRTVAVCRTAMPMIEKWSFINDGRQIVVKSRGNHGPASVELFNAVDGSLSDKVLAFAIRKSNVRWARGFED